MHHSLPANNGGNDVEGVIESRWQLVRKICHARLPLDEVDDAVQETFLQLLKCDTRHVRNMDAWLCVVAVRTCIRLHRQRYHRSEVPLDPVGEAVEDTALADVLDAVWFRRVCRSLAAADRDLLHALYIAPRPRNEVAELLGVTSGHLRVMAHRARRRAQLALKNLDNMGVSA